MADTPDLDRMTVAQLRAYARGLGLSSVTRLDKRAELLRALRKWLASR